MKKITFGVALMFATLSWAQNNNPYKFTHIVNNDHTAVSNQGKTGTCWSFSTVSFLESEVKRITGKTVDLSEMFVVRNTYTAKAKNYVHRQGKAQFSEGGMAHDVLNAVRTHGIVPFDSYTGFVEDQTKYDHSILIQELTAYVDRLVNYPKAFLKPDWINGYEQILDSYMGKKTKTIVYEGKTYTPQEFASYLKINPDDYISFTSFTHAPYYKSFVLDIPDNFSNGSFYNLPLDEYMQLMDEAINKGFTISFSSDVSEPTFSAKEGMAIWPAEGKKEDYFKVILPEKWVTSEERQLKFETYDTQDDHLMQITGIVKDQLGNQYYDVKNSWGTDLANGGDVYMSKAFMRKKSIAFLVHKDAVPNALKKKLGI